MGSSHSREDLDLTSSSEDEEDDAQSPTSGPPASQRDNLLRTITPASLESLDAKLKSLDLKYQHPNAAKLYLYVSGASPSARWVPAERRTTYAFVNKVDAGDRSSSSSSPRRRYFGTVRGRRICSRLWPRARVVPREMIGGVEFCSGGGVLRRG